LGSDDPGVSYDTHFDGLKRSIEDVTMSLQINDAAAALQSVSVVLGSVAFGLASDAQSLAQCLLMLNAAEPIAIVARRTLSDALNIEAILSGQPQPALAMSRGLSADLMWCREQHTAAIVVVDLAILEIHYRDEITRVGQLIRLLGGYELDQTVWLPALDHLVMDAVAALPKARACSLVLAGDKPHSMLTRLWPLARIVAMGNALKATPPAAALAPAPTSIAMPPSVEQVADHARFLMGQDFHTLKGMHAALGIGPFADVYAVWQANLGVLATHDRFRDVATRGAAVLAALMRPL
jgi:hypothetical protein